MDFCLSLFENLSSWKFWRIQIKLREDNRRKNIKSSLDGLTLQWIKFKYSSIMNVIIIIIIIIAIIIRNWLKHLN
jgi:Na+/H+-translocating membrane pyrophosphatase